MNVYRVENMKCGHCVSTIGEAIHAWQETAEVDVDLAGGIVRIECDDALAQVMASAMSEAGYPASRLGLDANVTPVFATTQRSRCCCG